MSAPLSFSNLLRYLLPVDRLSGARALTAALESGALLEDALKTAAPQLTKVAVSDAAGAWEPGPLALFIVDVRDSLSRQLLLAARCVSHEPVRMALRRAAGQARQDTFVQHLINTLVQTHQAYSEAMVLKQPQYDASQKALTELLLKSLCVLLARTDARRHTAERPRRIEFIALPQPSAPRP